MALRDIALAELTGGVVHIAHMSARQTLDAVRYGKARGARVTCEVTPHHFVLTDEMLAAPVPYDTNVKMNPPLREAADRDAMLAGPRRRQRRRHRHRPRAASLRREARRVRSARRSASPASRRRCRCASIGWCTPASITLSRLVELLSVNPARILQRAGRLAVGGRAGRHHDPRAGPARSPCRRRAMRSKSKNTPFDGWTLRGGVAATIVGGRVGLRERRLSSRVRERRLEPSDRGAHGQTRRSFARRR